MSQIHKRFNDDQAKIIFQWYLNKSLPLEQALERLGLKKRRFFYLLRKYREDSEHFTINYPKRKAHNKITSEVEEIIEDELKKEQSLIKNKSIPVKYYNYSAVRDEVEKRSGCNLSAQTIRNRAREWEYRNPPKPKKRHDREVETTAVGMLLQHDSSLHLWSPFAENKWSLVTTLDDYSRKLLYGDLFELETAWSHIEATEHVILKYGAGLAYYVDNHSIFRFVCYRDSIWRNEVKGTDDVITEWRQAVENCGMQVWYAGSAEAKGKIERPYRWLQDRIVRKCAHEGISTIQDARIILQEEIKRYNERQVHSTTKEIPEIRFQRAIEEGKTVFKPFQLAEPYTSTKDIFCLQDTRIVNNYGQITWKKYKISIPRNVPTGSSVVLKIIPDEKTPEIRIWHKDKLVKVVRLIK